MKIRSRVVPHKNYAEKNWEDKIRKLKKLRLQISQEDEQILDKIINKH